MTEPGFCTCKVCGGYGIYFLKNLATGFLIYDYIDSYESPPEEYSCLCCRGAGKLDWIDCLFNPNKEEIIKIFYLRSNLQVIKLNEVSYP